MNNTATSTGDSRVAFIDYMKSFAIVAVVIQHTLLPHWHPGTPRVDEVIRSTVWFHVPMFLLASGYLFSSVYPISGKQIALRAKRLIVPYMVATIIWYVVDAKRGPSITSFVETLIYADQLPIYYFVHLILGCTAFAWFVSRLSLAWELPLLLSLFGAAVFFTVFPQDDPFKGWYWGTRNAYVYLLPFMVGWYWSYPDSRTSRVMDAPSVLVLLVFTGLIIGVLGVQNLEPDLGRTCQRIFRNVFTVALAGLVSRAFRGPKIQAWALFLSEASYPIFLYHFPLVIWLLSVLPKDTPPVARIVAVTIVALLGSVAFVVAVSRLVGRRSSVLFGACLPLSDKGTGNA